MQAFYDSCEFAMPIVHYCAYNYVKSTKEVRLRFASTALAWLEILSPAKGNEDQTF